MEEAEPPSLVIQSKDPSVLSKIQEFGKQVDARQDDRKLTTFTSFRHYLNASQKPARAVSKTQINIDLLNRRQERLSTRGEGNRPQTSLRMGQQETLTAVRSTPKQAIAKKLQVPKPLAAEHFAKTSKSQHLRPKSQAGCKPSQLNSDLCNLVGGGTIGIQLTSA